ncbi:aldo/keto reductase [Actinoplanes sp. GCM10030250]|uniref:aldo/keto reductase n=1 Tax=Actinoplanes sp. GCM10030250 TaxID=3273376 RepID=UPI00361081FD
MDPFERVPLGRTGVTVTRLGMGLAPIGGLYSAVGDDCAMAAIDTAWQHGVRFFDTAPLYGSGLSERRSGAALGKRDRAAFTLSTKVGRRLAPGTENQAGIWAEPGKSVPVWDFSTAGVRESHRESLERLGLDRVDVLHLHDPDDHYTAAVTEALPTLVELRREGTIGAVSAGMNQSAMLTEFARTGHFDCFLLAGRYSLLDQSGLADLLPECHRRGISVIVGGVYNSGVLADPRPGASYDYRPAPPEVIARAQAMARLCDRYGVPLRAAALQFPLGHPAVAAVLVGMRSPEEAADAAAMAQVPIPGGLWRDLVSAWLLDPEVPVA